MAGKTFNDMGSLKTNPHSANITPTPSPETQSEEKKNTVGRPKTRGDYKVLSVAVPADMMDKIEAASLLYKGKVTAYINQLISDDMKQNQKKYMEVKAFMESVGK